MTKSSIGRAEKYKKKIKGVVFSSASPCMKASFAAAASAQQRFELLPRTLPTCKEQSSLMLPYYIDFARGINRILKKHGGLTVNQEVNIEKQRWLTRGLNNDCLDAIMASFGFAVGGEVITDYECNATGHNFMLYQADGNCHAGNVIELTARRVTALSFWLKKSGNPTGDVYFRIANMLTEAILWEQLMFDASTLTNIFTEYSVIVPSVVLNEACNKYAFLVSCVTAPLGWTNRVDVQATANKLCCSGSGFTNDNPFALTITDLTPLHVHCKISFQSL